MTLVRSSSLWLALLLAACGGSDGPADAGPPDAGPLDAGPGDAGSEGGELLECAQVCESHDDCVDDEFDQTACASACESYVRATPTNEAQLFDCDACYAEMGDACDDRCNARCAGILPAL